MHIDGIKEISNVQGYEVNLVKNEKQKEEQILGYDESKEL